MKKNSILVALGAICTILIIGAVWYLMLDKTPPLPDIHVPGMKSIEKVSIGKMGGDFEVVIQHLGMDYTCSLHVALSADREWILPLATESFTVVVSDEKNLELTYNNQRIGNVPVVFIAPINSNRTYRVGAPAQSKRPIYVKAGSVNLASFSENTLIRGVEGLRIKIFEDGKEIADGRIPMALSLEKPSTCVVEGLQTRTLTGKGLIQGYWGTQTVRVGTNSILPAGRFTGVDMVKFQGVPFARKDNELVLINIAENKMIRYNGETTHEITLGDIHPQTDKINLIRENGDVIFMSQENIIHAVSVDGVITEIKFENEFDSFDMIASDDFLITTTGSIYDISTGKNSKLEFDYDFFHNGIGLIFEDGKLSGSKLSTEKDEIIWQIETTVSPASELIPVKDDIVFFRIENNCSMYLNVADGSTSMTIAAFLPDAGLTMISTHDLNFPGGEGLNTGIIAFSADGEMAWSRPDGEISHVGHGNVMVTNTDEIRVYDLKTGIETCSWKHDPTSSVHPTDGVNVLYADEFQTVISLQTQKENNEMEFWTVVALRKAKE